MRFLRLFLSFLKYRVKRELEFRFNLSFLLIFDLAWIVINLFSVTLIFRQAGTVAGWTRQEGILLLFVYYVASSLIKVFVVPGVQELSELVRLGRLDLYLVKPAEIRLLVIFGEMQLVELSRFFLMFGIIPWYLQTQSIIVHIDQWILFSLFVLMALIGIFGVYFSIAVLSFWIQNTYNIGDLFRETIDAAKRPVEIFPATIRNFVTFVVPIGLIASIPTQVLLGHIGWSFLPPVLFAAVFLFLFSNLFFKFALRHYTSASS